ncbi:hypothetical protein LJK88_18220 [Paenibacillus sp. P26]|nr:hypothetical protein LJK88_18220 [Paenibacillus sp. P26]
MILQQIRYDFEFDVQIHAEGDVLEIPIPRFILQPLVENALYHGLSDDGFIQVDVRGGDRIEISIRDNGAGMTEEAIRNVLNRQEADSRKVGMGIGMNYVKRVIETQYGPQAQLSIQSEVGQGTTVFLSLPVMEGAG